MICKDQSCCHCYTNLMVQNHICLFQHMNRYISIIVNISIFCIVEKGVAKRRNRMEKGKISGNVIYFMYLLIKLKQYTLCTFGAFLMDYQYGFIYYKMNDFLKFNNTCIDHLSWFIIGKSNQTSLELSIRIINMYNIQPLT